MHALPSSPSSIAPPEALGVFVAGGLGVPSNHGWGWLKTAWKLFTRQPLFWVGISVFSLVVAILISFFPIVGGIANQIFYYFMGAGYCACCLQLINGQRATLRGFFSVFKSEHLTGIAILVAVMFGVTLVGIVVAIVILIVLQPQGAQSWSGMKFEEIFNHLITNINIVVSIPLILVVVMLIFFVSVLTFYAVPLITINRLGAFVALKKTLRVMAGNVPAFLVNGLVNIALILAGLLPLFLGMLVVMPLLWIQLFTTYHDLFYRQKRPNEPVVDSQAPLHA